MLPYVALTSLKESLRTPTGYGGCIRPGNVQAWVDYISRGKLNIQTIDREGKDTLHAPQGRFEGPMHSFYGICYEGQLLGRLYFPDKTIKQPQAIKEALEHIIDDALTTTLNGHIQAIDYHNQQYHIQTKRLTDISLGYVLDYS